MSRRRQPHTILLAEDDQDDYLHIRALLAALPGTPYTLDWVATSDAARAALTQQRHAAYLVTDRLGAGSGVDLVREMAGAGVTAPIIVLTRHGDHSVAVLALQAGAADYLVKGDLSPALLDRALRDARPRGRGQRRGGAAPDLGETQGARLRRAAERQHAVDELLSDFAYAFRVLPDGTVVRDWVSGAVTPITGYTAEELDAREGGWEGLIHPDDRPIIQRRLQALTAGTAVGSEFRIVAKAGQVRWLRDHVRLLPPADQAVIAGYGLVHDITLAKQAEEQLRFQAYLLDSVGQAVIALDLEERITYWNHAAEELYGWTAAEAVGRAAQLLVPSRQPSGQAGEIMARLRAGKSWTGEFTVQRRDGTTFPALVSNVPLRDGQGAVIGFIGVSTDNTARKQAEEALAHQALHDALTALPNRVLLQDRLEQALRSAQRSATPVALLLLDLDRFKEVNDTLGHQSGDLLLQEVSRRLVRTVRVADTVARLSGDEFALLLPAVTSAPQAAQTATRLLGALAQPVFLQGVPVRMEASVGIALFPDHGADAQTLLQHAEVAMYAAKRAGHGYALYVPERDPNSARRLGLLTDLRATLEAEGLVLHYQPTVTMATGQIRSVEALARWPHPTRGHIPPSEFIPLAESTGLIELLSRWSLTTALRQCRAWQESGRALSVAVNLSARTLQDLALPDTLRTALQDSQVAGASLTVEITESVLMADPDRAQAVLVRLHELGVRLAIDDFGTGYSSLAYLNQLPVDELKIDRSFVSAMTARPNAAMIVRSIIALAHNLGLLVVAEGIEDGDTWNLLARLDCDIAQGYYVSRPLPATDVVPWVEEQAAPGVWTAHP